MTLVSEQAFVSGLFVKSTQNVRLSDVKKSPEIFVISGVILFGKAFGNLCSGKGRFAENRLTLSD